MDVSNSSKDSHDDFLCFSRITADNWLAPDRKDRAHDRISKEDWISGFLEPRLDETVVPQQVIKVFEIARAAMIYSWFFYPLATLGVEQCTRIGEFAIREYCRANQQQLGNFSKNIEKLAIAGFITAEDKFRWHAIRKLRNDRSHLEGLMLLDDRQALDYLRTTVELINGLFSSRNQESK